MPDRQCIVSDIRAAPSRYMTRPSIPRKPDDMIDIELPLPENHNAVSNCEIFRLVCPHCGEVTAPVRTSWSHEEWVRVNARALPVLTLNGGPCPNCR